jgi:glycopeptide antibiotics resistance protein
VGSIIILALLFRQRRSGFLHELALALFGLYLMAVLDAIFFPILIPENWPTNLNAADTLRALQGVNWRPFYFGSPASSAAYPGANMQRFRWFDIIGNILLTIPLGLGLPYFTRVKTKSILWVALAAGLLFEGTQLLIKLVCGVYYHTVDINDVIWNGLGVLLGFGIFRVGNYMVQQTKLRK